jgi:hypothetical protein
VIRPIIVAAAACVALGGCKDLSTDITALANDKNPVCLSLTTPWGTESYSRLFGCSNPPPVGTITVAPSAASP